MSAVSSLIYYRCLCLECLSLHHLLGQPALSLKAAEGSLIREACHDSLPSYPVESVTLCGPHALYPLLAGAPVSLPALQLLISPLVFPN